VAQECGKGGYKLIGRKLSHMRYEISNDTRMRLHRFI
jgi:hypothetical protein